MKSKNLNKIASCCAFTLRPNRLFVKQHVRQPLAVQNFRMDSNDQRFLAIGTIEHADPAAFRQSARGAPQKIMVQFLGTGMGEAEHLASLGIDTGHDMADGAVLAGRVYCLKNP